MPPSSKLQYRVLVSGLLPVSGLPPPDGTRPRWSPLSHTLMFGPAEAVVVDPPITVAQATALANWIESFGKRLTYITSPTGTPTTGLPPASSPSGFPT